MALSSARVLHYVLKVGDRDATVHFLHDVLGMHALRHEEFREGCKAACNGPHDGRWSKTMMGYDSEDAAFVLELTYNYGVSSYRRGNDFGYFKVRSRVAYAALEEQGLGQELAFNVREVRSPDGHAFRVLNEDPDPAVGALASACLHVADLPRALAWWCDGLGLLEVDRGDDFAVLSAGADQATLRLKQLPAGTSLDRGTGFGRIAYSCPTADLAALQEEAVARGGRLHTPLVRLDTPGKASVQAVILQDPDGHEVCFVGDEGFRQLSRPDDNAWQQLSRAMSLDASRKRKPEGSPAASPTAAAAAAKIAAPAAAPAAAPTAAAAGSGSPQAAAAAGGSPKAVPAAKAPPPSTAAAAAK